MALDAQLESTVKKEMEDLETPVDADPSPPKAKKQKFQAKTAAKKTPTTKPLASSRKGQQEHIIDNYAELNRNYTYLNMKLNQLQ